MLLQLFDGSHGGSCVVGLDCYIISRAVSLFFRHVFKVVRHLILALACLSIYLSI